MYIYMLPSSTCVPTSRGMTARRPFFFKYVHMKILTCTYTYMYHHLSTYLSTVREMFAQRLFVFNCAVFCVWVRVEFNTRNDEYIIKDENTRNFYVYIHVHTYEYISCFFLKE